MIRNVTSRRMTPLSENKLCHAVWRYLLVVRLRRANEWISCMENVKKPHVFLYQRSFFPKSCKIRVKDCCGAFTAIGGSSRGK